MKKIILPFVAIGVLLLVGCLPDPLPPAAPTTDGLNYLNYKYNTDHTEDVLDIYRAADEVRPAVMLIHGGAWITSGGLENYLGRKSMVQFKDRFLGYGYHVVNIDYRLIKVLRPDGTDYKDMLADIRSAVEFIYDNSSDFKIDTSKIVMYGYSSGAHLAELYSYKVTDSPIPVRLCVGRAGPTDFWNEEFRTCDVFGGFSDAMGMTPEEAANFKGNVIEMIKGAIKAPNATEKEIEDGLRVYIIKNLLGISAETEDVTTDINDIINNDIFKSVIDDVSPITHVNAASPNTILLHGKQDTLVPYRMAESLNAKLNDNNVECLLISLEKSGHGLNNPADEAELKRFDNGVEFVLRLINLF